MSTNASSLATKFYDAFVKGDANKMSSLYAPNATFSDAVFVGLTGIEAGAMWQMLCARSKDLKISYEILDCTEETAKIRWQAYYTFTKTGRFVHNTVDATIGAASGKIVVHVDKFSFWKWSRQALGPIGFLLGWSSILKNKVRQDAMISLRNFIKKREVSK